MSDALDVDDLHRRVFDAVPAALYVSRVADGMILMVNKAVETVLGYSQDEMVGRRAADLELWVDIHQRSEVVALVERDGRVVATPARLRRRDGAIIEILASVQAIDLGGERCLVTVSHDVTEHSQAERALRRSEQRLRQIAESIDEGFILASIEPFHMLYASRAYADLLGTTLDAVYAEPARMIDAIHPDDRDAVRASRGQMLAGVPTHEVEARVRSGGSGERWVRFRWTRVEGDDDGTPRELVAAVVEDITDRKRSERELDRARAQAEEASRAKSTFLSRVSHELRTPLNVILGFGQLLEIDDLHPDQQEALDEIMEAGQHLLHLVDEVLDISRSEAGELDLVHEPVPLAEVVPRVIERLAPEAARRGIEVRADRSCVQVVRGDPRRLGEALRQIVDNAIVHNTLTGTVDVRCEPRPGSRVRIVVEDTGPGLSPEDLERAFLPFERTPGTDGTGLGLALARRLVEAMGGEVGARSVPGRGSRFWIDLEAAPADAPRPQPARPGPLRVLYIEDNASNAELVTRALGGSGGTSLVVATRGQEGVALLASEPFDLVLLDLHLPDISGEEVLRRVRADRGLAALPVVVISADASPEVISRVLAAGAVEYLTKPINIAHLIRVVERRAGPPSDPGPVARPAAPPPPSPPDADSGVLDEQVLESLQVLEEIEAGTIGDLIELFARAGRARVVEMEALAAGDGDLAALADLAHALRGSGANLGARELAAVCHRLERAAHDGEGATARSLVPEVRRAFDVSLVLLLDRAGRRLTDQD